VIDLQEKKLMVPKRVMEAPDVGFGVCLWRKDDGTYIQNSNGEYLCVQSRINDPLAERNMRRAARDMGIEEGKPMWMPGFRRVSNMEWEDEMADLLDGKIPDPVDAYHQLKYDN
jgi:hypothetical protein